MIRAAIMLAVLVTAPPESSAEPRPGVTDSDCKSAQSIRFICGIRAPEDFVQLPGEDKVVVSSYTRPGGALYLVDVRSRSVLRLSPSWNVAAGRSGFPDCPGPPKAFVPLGLDVQRNGPGRYRLFATNSVTDPRIEVFDLTMRRGAVAALAWIGCIMGAPATGVNGVVALPDGAVVVTSTLDPADPKSYEKLLAGSPTGSVSIWRPGGRWSRIDDGQLSGPNGVAASRDGTVLYVSSWGDQTVNRVDIARGMNRIVRHKFAFRPDNLRWGRDGKLYAAGFAGTSAQLDLCIRKAHCDLTSYVVALNPRDDTFAPVLKVAPVPARFGAATVAVPVGGDIWLGSFQGESIAILSRPPEQGR